MSTLPVFCRQLSLGLVTFVLPLVSQADEIASVVTSKSGLATLPATQDPVAMASLWQLTLGMLVVLALIASIAWVLKRTGRFQMATGGSLRVLGGLSMGSRERVVLIQAGDTQLLLGVAPGRVQTLHVLDKPLQQNVPGSGGFAEQLSKVLKKDKTA